jgi:hypothetical protein
LPSPQHHPVEQLLRSPSELPDLLILFVDIFGQPPAKVADDAPAILAYNKSLPTGNQLHKLLLKGVFPPTKIVAAPAVPWLDVAS